MNWSAPITQNSRALELEPGVFTWKSARRIAELSADRSRNRKGTSFQSAMSMLNFYINRAGPNLSAERRIVLNKAKVELRKLYGRH